jgi:hypothetical protein
MSDYKSAALMLDLSTRGKTLLGDRAHDADGSVLRLPSATSSPASRQRKTVRCQSRTIPRSIVSAMSTSGLPGDRCR